MKFPALLLSTTSLLLAHPASAQVEWLDPAASSMSAWYAVLIAVFAVLVGIGLVSSQRDAQDRRRESQRPPEGPHPHSGSADARSLRRSKNDDQ